MHSHTTSSLPLLFSSQPPTAVHLQHAIFTGFTSTTLAADATRTNQAAGDPSVEQGEPQYAPIIVPRKRTHHMPPCSSQPDLPAGPMAMPRLCTCA
jgi:hypothetical protein